MNAAAAWCWWAWLQIWPNLAANLIWLPAVWGWVAYRDVQLRRHHGETLRQAVREELAVIEQKVEDAL